MAETYGWAGKILRVNLTTGEITTQDDAKYHKYIGGMGMAYRHKLLFHKQLLQKFKLLFRIAFRQFPGMNAGRIEISLFTCRPDIRSRQAQRIIHR